MSVIAGEVALFRCENSDAEFIRWKIIMNGTLLRRPYPPGITTNRNESILNIRGHPDYNGTVIACVAFIPGLHALLTPNVTLTVYEGTFL